MKNFKVLPLTIAVASSLAAMSTFAATDADVAALEARIAELESRTETLSVNVQEQNVLPADIELRLVSFSLVMLATALPMQQVIASW